MHPQVAALLRSPQCVQRTPEWYAARRECITASDAAAALGIKPYASYKGDVRAECLRKKLENEFFTNLAVEHGQKYEDEARDMAMARTGMTAHDVGLLRHAEHRWLGASPDGLTECGRVLEIKCPLRRKIVRGEVPHHYFPQIQVQLFVCDLPEALFIEYRPAALTKGEPVLEITPVPRDDAWIAGALPRLRSFFDDYRRGLETHVPRPRPPPPTCLIVDGLYAPL